ncbi:MAG: hypothetical protein KJZ96_12835 [Rhodocyclaceae bacterium]|nr:hypothetical protein [Rhodocyclaceae bacterium]MCL4759221.1 hypothetical protein [Rhodocyclaceae bacterium]
MNDEHERPLRVRLGSRIFAAIVLAGCALASHAQTGGGGGQAAAAQPSAAVAGFRNTGGYRSGSVAQTVRRLQNVATAMQLREYCSDPRIEDEFVRIQLARFSLITGRSESCATLLDY